MPDRVLWIIAADSAVAALAFAQLLSGDERLAVALAFVIVAAAITALLALRGLWRAARSGDLARLAGGLLVAGLVTVVVLAGRHTVGTEPVLLALVAFAGLALVLRWIVAAIETADAEASPWQGLAGVAPPRRRPVDGRAGAAFGALLLVLAGVGAARFALAGTDSALRAFGVGVALVAVLTAVVAAPLALVAQARARRTRRAREVGRHRQDVAAHLHDSVLQTLALIQRSADDPQQVLHLARKQERGLRAWLAGQDDSAPPTVGVALRAVAAEVEDEVAGAATIEVVLVQDARLDDAWRTLVDAAREAMRNAARHAGGTVRVVLDREGDALVAFIRDDGAGFDLSAVAAERRGVRDAIIGRMRHAGGDATIESSAEGTEVVLMMPMEDDR
ncbi:MAG: hypothetical protein PGN13_08805 [Patulibacter minatonensis]